MAGAGGRGEHEDVGAGKGPLERREPGRQDPGRTRPAENRGAIDTHDRIAGAVEGTGQRAAHEAEAGHHDPEPASHRESGRSSTSSTRRASALGANGFWMKAAPGGRPPWWWAVASV